MGIQSAIKMFQQQGVCEMAMLIAQHFLDGHGAAVAHPRSHGGRAPKGCMYGS